LWQHLISRAGKLVILSDPQAGQILVPALKSMASIPQRRFAKNDDTIRIKAIPFSVLKNKWHCLFGANTLFHIEIRFFNSIRHRFLPFYHQFDEH
jgi:hypothetical protein